MASACKRCIAAGSLPNIFDTPEEFERHLLHLHADDFAGGIPERLAGLIETPEHGKLSAAESKEEPAAVETAGEEKKNSESVASDRDDTGMDVAGESATGGALSDEPAGRAAPGKERRGFLDRFRKK